MAANPTVSQAQRLRTMDPGLAIGSEQRNDVMAFSSWETRVKTELKLGGIGEALNPAANPPQWMLAAAVGYIRQCFNRGNNPGLASTIYEGGVFDNDPCLMMTKIQMHFMPRKLLTSTLRRMQQLLLYPSTSQSWLNVTPPDMHAQLVLAQVIIERYAVATLVADPGRYQVPEASTVSAMCNDPASQLQTVPWGVITAMAGVVWRH